MPTLMNITGIAVIAMSTVMIIDICFRIVDRVKNKTIKTYNPLYYGCWVITDNGQVGYLIKWSINPDDAFPITIADCYNKRISQYHTYSDHKFCRPTNRKIGRKEIHCD